MWNRRGAVVRYNRHVYTLIQIGLGQVLLLREIASAAAVVRNGSVCTVMHTKLDRCQGKWIFLPGSRLY